MANAVFTAAEGSSYDDQIEDRYHFPHTYLKQVENAVGDLIVYYEPRRNPGSEAATGRQSYFAVARLVDIKSDTSKPNHYYGLLEEFLEFDQPVPFKQGARYFESMLEKNDGTTNRGAFGRSVRLIPRAELDAILQVGFAEKLEPWEQADRISEPVPEYVSRPVIETVVSRKFRDAAFRRHVRNAYNNTCAVTGFKLLNGGGRPEVQAAHIRPVEANGPDTVKNGLALTGTIHWLFDRGLISFSDNHKILLSSHGIPDDLDRLIPATKSLILPANHDWYPHPTYLKWHRDNRFKSD
ncbi:MAG: HNH endonuclease [Proteobacteria bacterium]|nr:HNH endonuclease [Pseudomonadota bacterium]